MLFYVSLCEGLHAAAGSVSYIIHVNCCCLSAIVIKDVIIIIIIRVNVDNSSKVGQLNTTSGPRANKAT